MNENVILDITSAIRQSAVQEEDSEIQVVPPISTVLITEKTPAGSTLESRISSWVYEYNQLISRGENPQSIIYTFRDITEAYIDEHEEISIDKFYQYMSKYDTLTEDPELYIAFYIDIILSEEDGEDIKTLLSDQYNNFFRETKLPMTASTIVTRTNNIIDGLYSSIPLATVIRERMEKDLKQLTNIQPLSIYSTEQSYTESLAYIKLNGRDINSKDIKPIFDNLYLDDRTPMAIYWYDENIHYKVYENDRENFDLSLVPKPRDPNTIHIGVQLLNERKTKQELRLITINSATGIVSVQSEIDFEILREILPYMKLEYNNINRTKVRSKFTIADLTMYLEAFYYFIMMDDVFSKYIYTSDDLWYKDDQTPRPLIVRYNRYVIPNTLYARETHIRVLLSTKYVSKHVDGDGEILSAVEFSMENVTHNESDFVISIISRAMNKYKQQENSILSYYRREWGYDIPQWKLPKLSEIDRLRLLKPNIFGSDYLSTCGRKYPTQITKQQYLTGTKKWREDHAAEVKNTKSDNEPIYITCDENKANQYVGYRTKEDKVVVPCCVAKKNIQVERGHISVNQLLAPGMKGYMLGLSKLFGLKESEKKGVTSIERRGIVQSSRSFMTAVATALSNKYQEIQPTADGLMKYMDKMSVASQRISPFLQCMYNYKESDIVKYLNYYGDSDLVADGIGLNIKHNIYVLYEVDNKYKLRKPNYAFAYYPSYYVNRPCVVIYRYEIANIVYYEPVISKNKSGFYNWVHDEKISEIFRNEFNKNNVTEFMDQNGNYTSISTEANEEGMLYEDSLQIIDNYGKWRGVVVDGLGIYFDSPRAPIVGKYVKRIDEVENRRSYAEWRDENIEEVIPEQWKNVVIGDAIIGVPTEASLIKGTTTYIVHNDVDRVRKYAKAQEIRSYILQLTNLLFSLLVDISPEDFMSTYVIIDDKVRYNFGNVNNDVSNVTFKEMMNLLKTTGFTNGKSIVLPTDAVFRGVYQMLDDEVRTRKTAVPEIPKELIGFSNDKQQVKFVNGINYRTLSITGEGRVGLWADSRNPLRNSSVVDLTLEEVQTSQSPFTFVSRGLNKIDRWLVQNVSRGQYERALYCSMMWNYNKTNTGYFSQALSASFSAEILKYCIIYSWDPSGVLVPDTVPEREDMATMSILVYPKYKKTGNEIKGAFAALLRLTED